MLSEDKPITSNLIFAWIALGTALLLLIPLVAMQFTDEVNWQIADFIVMGCLLFGAGSLFVIGSRKIAPKHRLPLAAGVIAMFLYIWAELAVGIFTNLGS